MRIAAILVPLLAIMPAASAHEYLSFEELTAAFGMDLENTDIRSEEVSPGLHVLFGVGGNVLVSIGEQGVLMVDSQFPEMIPRINDAIRRLGGGEIDFTINTHWHFDHADGNATLGRDGTWLVAHTNTRRMMTGERDVSYVDTTYRQPAYDHEALPVVTYDDHMQLHLNEETVDLLHFGPAHTTGDTAVYFRTANVVHMGDVFFTRYPYIDAGNGGDIVGMQHFCEAVLARLDEESRVVPGHGPVVGYAELADYASMLATVAGRLSAMIDRGMSLEQILAAGPTADYDDRYGNPQLFIVKAYESLSR